MPLFGPSFSSVDEAKIRIGELRLKIKQLQQQKREYSEQMAKVRQKYRGRATPFTRGLRIGGARGVASFLNANRASARDSELSRWQRKKDDADREINSLQKEILKVQMWIDRHQHA
jgi:peptidoglycan hydrolase CwlO-like protein